MNMAKHPELTRRVPAVLQQADLYRQLQQRLLEQLPYVPLWFESQYFAARDDIVGYRLAADGNFDALSRVTRH